MKHPYLDIEVPEEFKSIEELISYYESIPDENWMTGFYYSTERQTCCALGHLNFHINGGEHIWNNFAKIIPNYFINNKVNLASVNDKICKDYQQTTPKQRVIAFLNDKIKERDEKDNI